MPPRGTATSVPRARLRLRARAPSLTPLRGLGGATAGCGGGRCGMVVTWGVESEHAGETSVRKKGCGPACARVRVSAAAREREHGRRRKARPRLLRRAVLPEQRGKPALNRRSRWKLRRGPTREDRSADRSGSSGSFIQSHLTRLQEPLANEPRSGLADRDLLVTFAERPRASCERRRSALRIDPTPAAKPRPRGTRVHPSRHGA